MKKLLLALLVLFLQVFLSGCAMLPKQEPDYLAQMAEAAARADTERGHAAQLARDARLDKTGAPEARVDFDELLLLARALYCQAGDAWCTGQLRLCAGEVLLNRVASPEFPDTLAEVVAEEPWAQREDFAALPPGKDCADAALALLLGERMLDERVVYRSAQPLGGGVYATFCDRRYRYTYFCLTENPELYPDTNTPTA